MAQYKYLIIGGGMTADSAVNGIREHDTTGSIGLISAEIDPPYDRPPLTKGLWKDKPLESVWRKTADKKVEMHLRRTVTRIDLQRKEAVDKNGETYSFEKLLVATGGSPKTLPFGIEDIIYFRTVGDYRRLRELTAKGERFLVIGGGFIGSELAGALCINHKKVTMLVPGKGICARMFPSDLSEFLNKYYGEKGVELLIGDSAVGLERRNGRLVVKTQSKKQIEVDGVLAGIGITPNVELAKAAGLKVEDGIVVDEFLRTSAPDVYAAGDVASFYNPLLERRVRVEHEDNANTMGKLAGENMAGNAAPYHHLPFFYSDLFDLGYEAIGDTDSRLEIFADWKEPFREGVIYYLKEGRVRGVVLWNVWGQVDAARALMGEKRKFGREELKGRFPKN